MRTEMRTKDHDARRKIVTFPPTLEEQINDIAQQRGESFSSTLRGLARERIAQLQAMVEKTA